MKVLQGERGKRKGARGKVKKGHSQTLVWVFVAAERKSFEFGVGVLQSYFKPDLKVLQSYLQSHQMSWSDNFEAVSAAQGEGERVKERVLNLGLAFCNLAK